MNYKIYIYAIMLLVTAFSLSGVNFTGVFKKNHEIEAKIMVVLINGEYVIMINPEIVEKSKQVYETTESCLSLIGSRPATRHKDITVEYLDKKFKHKKRKFKDFEAQVIQHEIDHFDGILI